MKSIDLIHNRLLISAADVISDPFISLFNRSLREGRFPNLEAVLQTVVHTKKHSLGGACRSDQPVNETNKQKVCSTKPPTAVSMS